MFTSAYLKALGERALVAFAAALAAVLTTDGFNLQDPAGWKGAVLSAVGTTVVTIVVSVAGGAVTSSKAPALTSKETQVELAQAPQDDQPYL